MYNETIKAENRIIDNQELYTIFQEMAETLKKYQKSAMLEEEQNKMLDYHYQRKYLGHFDGAFKAHVDFYDNTDITFDNYDNFISIFYSRIEEIKSINITYRMSFSIRTPETYPNDKYIHHSITIYMTENKFEVSPNLNSEDDKLNDIYNSIKNMVLNAPEKYDMIIKKKSSIMNTVALSIGLIPSMIIVGLLIFAPVVGNVVLHGFVVYPILAFILSFFMGSIISSSKLEKYYASIVPNKKYAGYSDGHSIYKDDIESFTSTSEILIGKKANNLSNRKHIKEEYESYKAKLGLELIVLVIVSLIVAILGLVM